MKITSDDLSFPIAICPRCALCGEPVDPEGNSLGGCPDVNPRTLRVAWMHFYCHQEELADIFADPDLRERYEQHLIRNDSAGS